MAYDNWCERRVIQFYLRGVTMRIGDLGHASPTAVVVRLLSGRRLLLYLWMRELMIGHQSSYGGDVNPISDFWNPSTIKMRRCIYPSSHR